MELPVIIILILILVSLIVISWSLLAIEHWLAILSDLEPEHTEEAKVTDPFTKPKEIYSSTNHIVVPKTPTEIRNQNFKRIKEGLEYGDFKKED